MIITLFCFQIIIKTEKYNAPAMNATFVVHPKVLLPLVLISVDQSLGGWLIGVKFGFKQITKQII